MYYILVTLICRYISRLVGARGISILSFLQPPLALADPEALKTPGPLSWCSDLPSECDEVSSSGRFETVIHL